MVRIGDDDWDDEPSDCLLTLAGDCIGHVLAFDQWLWATFGIDSADIRASEDAEDAALTRMVLVYDCSWLG